MHMDVTSPRLHYRTSNGVIHVIDMAQYYSIFPADENGAFLPTKNAASATVSHKARLQKKATMNNAHTSTIEGQ